MLNSVREINPDALTIARKLDDTKPSVKRPLFGIPVLVKDNIATGDDQATTAGSLALKGRAPRMTPPSSSYCAMPARSSSARRT